MTYIVPNELRDAIYEQIDAQIKENHELTPGREEIYGQILEYYNQHGVIPKFKIIKEGNYDGPE